MNIERWVWIGDSSFTNQHSIFLTPSGKLRESQITAGASTGTCSWQTTNSIAVSRRGKPLFMPYWSLQPSVHTDNRLIHLFMYLFTREVFIDILLFPGIFWVVGLYRLYGVVITIRQTNSLSSWSLHSNGVDRQQTNTQAMASTARSTGAGSIQSTSFS